MGNIPEMLYILEQPADVVIASEVPVRRWGGADEKFLTSCYRYEWIFQWLEGNEPYFDPPENLYPFYIRLNSVMYLGQVVNSVTGLIIYQHDNPDRISFYWRTWAPRQLGGHLFICRYGSLLMTSLIIENDVFQVTLMAPIVTVYPVIIYERGPYQPYRNPEEYETHRHTTPGDGWTTRACLSLGLYFRYYDENILARLGNRFYTRFANNWDPVNAGNVYDLTEDRLAGFANTPIPPPDSMFAIYVCEGAKLVVLDQYHQDWTERHHNRSFFQAGSVIIANYPIHFSSPQKSRGHNNTLLPSWYFTLADAFISGLLVRTSGDDMTQIENPVIFLGPNESEYNSSTWVLSINRSYQLHRAPFVDLMIPDGGTIVAIEEWQTGIEEIIARHQYKRFFLDVREYSVKMDANRWYRRYGFAEPQPNMLARILGTNAVVNRSIQSNIRLGMGRYHTDPFQTMTAQEFKQKVLAGYAQP